MILFYVQNFFSVEKNRFEVFGFFSLISSEESERIVDTTENFFFKP